MSGGNLYARFERVFDANAERIAIRSADGATALTFGDLARGAARYANALAALGVEPGDRVTVQVEKSIANVLLYLAVMKAGAVYQPLNTAYTAAEVAYFVEDAQPKLIVCDPARQAEMRALADRLRGLRRRQSRRRGRRLARHHGRHHGRPARDGGARRR